MTREYRQATPAELAEENRRIDEALSPVARSGLGPAEWVAEVVNFLGENPEVKPIFAKWLANKWGLNTTA